MNITTYLVHIRFITKTSLKTNSKITFSLYLYFIFFLFFRILSFTRWLLPTTQTSLEIEWSQLISLSYHHLVIENLNQRVVLHRSSWVLRIIRVRTKTYCALILPPFDLNTKQSNNIKIDIPTLAHFGLSSKKKINYCFIFCVQIYCISKGVTNLFGGRGSDLTCSCGVFFLVRGFFCLVAAYERLGLVSG